MVSKLRALSGKQISAAVAVAAICGVVGATSLTNAAPAGKPSQAEGDAAVAAGTFKNRGQCVSDWAKNKSGYGG